MFKFKKIIHWMIGTIIALFLCGIFFTIFDDEIAKLMLSDNDTKGIKTEWIGFWGNMFGSLIQGIATAAGIVVSVYLFNKDKKVNKTTEDEKREREEKETFIKDFGKILSAYDRMLYLVKHYDNLNNYYENNTFMELEGLTHEISNGEVTARVSLMQREISGYKRNREQGLTYYPEDTSYQDADGKIRRNMEHLMTLLNSKRRLHMEQFSNLTGIDLSEEVIWDKGRTFEGYLSEGVSVSATVTARATVIKNEAEE